MTIGESVRLNAEAGESTEGSILSIYESGDDIFGTSYISMTDTGSYFSNRRNCNH